MQHFKKHVHGVPIVHGLHVVGFQSIDHDEQLFVVETLSNCYYLAT
jgi:hypothetical protein